MAKKYYLIYRVYGPKERTGEETNSWIYGWSSNKNVVKAFLKQRNKNKYLVFKMDEEEIAEKFSDNELPSNKMIDCIKLKSAGTQEEFLLFMTLDEMQECETKIQTMMAELCYVDRIDNDRIKYYTNIILNIDDYYMDALHYIGYRPLEIECVFGSSEETVYDLIDIAYNGAIDYHPQEYYNHSNKTLPGLSVIEDIANKILYSFEAFIKVLKEDL